MPPIRSCLDNRIMIVGGTRMFNYEFVPKTPGEGVFNLPFLSQTRTSAQVENNLYPFLHLSSDGNLFIFANRDSILLNYKTNAVVKTFPRMPGDGPRNYPSTGSSVMLPLSAVDGFAKVEVLICGGCPDNVFALASAGNFTDALRSCGRMVITDPNPSWSMEDMPERRTMSDILILPNGEIIIINGAAKGVAGWDMATAPVLTPHLYRPSAPTGQRFFTLAATGIPRMYHSSASMLADGRVFVGGSNPHAGYVFSGTTFPTELRLEAYSPYYLENVYTSQFRPNIKSVSSNSISYAATFMVVYSFPNPLTGVIQFNAYAPSFTTHTNSMNQRLLSLAAKTSTIVSNGTGNVVYSSTVTAPPSAVAAPPGYYMLFVVNNGIPSVARWVQFS
ncbi:aldehyde oxidase GLOX-like [Cryptomeria japonica]|uniref:aldehyde oxidase GLOX-like n=1 Tax=Cryptomeria japonica TaxID=3369 RepID=UPI0025ABCE20|nr:aldehyde oxidase GLOX-like [Cryptomeria japonica]